MNINDLIKIKENELPLDNLLENGGYTNIFNTIAVIGDSLSSGEFEYVDKNNNTSFFDDINGIKLDKNQIKVVKSNANATGYYKLTAK